MKKTVSLISLLLACLTLVGGLGIFARAADADIAPSFDFSDGASSYRSELTPSELLNLISPDAVIDDAEIKYIDRYSDCFFLINDSFSNDTVRITRNDDKITVSAEEYSYTAQNGSLVRWIPEYAEYGDISLSFSLSENGAYICELPYSEGVTHISAEYSCSLLIPAEDANYLLNFAYREAVAGDELETKYSSVMNEYMESFRKYEEALAALEQYELDRESYEEYLIAYEEYRQELAEYTKYLAELAEYEKKLALHEQYLKNYEQYLKDKAEYDRVYSENIHSMDEYLAYYEQLNRIRSSMYAIENIYTAPGNGLNPLYKALQNKELVSMFEKYKSELTIYGIEESTIDNLSEVADELNQLLKSYNYARSTSEEMAFDFYCKYYYDICYMFNYLYDSMMEIMTPTIFNHICIMINTEYDAEMAQYKKWRITNVLAHIYLVSRCLDDTESAAGAWHFYDYERNEHTYYFPELLTPAVTISDTNAASPDGLSWPDNPPDFTLPPLPIEPEKVAKPLAPEKIDEPIEPERVNEPELPAEPVYPGEPPEGLEEVLKTSEIVTALREGSLTERAELSESITLKFFHTVRKLVSPEGYPVMTVYDYDKKTVIAEAIITSGGDIALPERAPERESDKRHDYSFLGWSLSPNALATPDTDELFASGEDFCLYAVYKVSDRLYSVTWVTADGEYYESYKYGETPTFSGNAEKKPTNTSVYSFEGWSPLPQAVTENAVYTAQYSESERKYSVTWKFRERTLTEKYSYGENPTPPSVKPYYIDGCELFVFGGWSPSVASEVTSDTVYNAIYSQKTLVSVTEGTAQLESHQSFYRITLSGSSANIGELLSLAASESKRVELVFDKASLSFDKDSVKALSASDAKSFSVEYTLEDGFGECVLSVKNANGKDISATGEMRLKIPYASELPKNFLVYEKIRDVKKETPYTFSDGYLTIPVSGSSSFTFTRLYSITFSEDEHGGTLIDGYLHEEGDSISPLFYPDRGYKIGKITVTRADNGVSYEIESFEGFTMPDSDITVTVSFERIQYTVTFVVNGETVSSQKYYIGDIPTAPEVPSEYEENGYKYVFAGWSATISAVTHDTVYYAKYNSFLIDMESSGQQTGNGVAAFIKFTVVPIAAIALIITSLAVLLIVYLRKRSKDKKGEKKKKPLKKKRK